MSFAGQLPWFSAACAALLAGGSLARRRRTLAEWAFSGGMAAFAAEEVLVALTYRHAGATSVLLSLQEWRLVASAFLPGFWLLFGLTYARGDAGHFLLQWKWPLTAAFAVPIGLAFGFSRSLVESLRGAGGSPMFHFGWSGVAVSLAVLAGSILVVMQLERTYRASVGTMRWRVKFMLLAVGLLFIVRLYTTSQAVIFRGAELSLETLNAATLIIATPLILRAFVRAGRIELDVYPSHLVLQGSLTVLLAGVYLVFVGVFARILAALGGSHIFGLEALLVLVSLVLLVALLQSDRLRVQLAHFVSRNFQRPLYDYRAIWRKFTEGTASQVQSPELCRSLVKLVSDVFQTLSVAIWLVDEKHRTLKLEASTFLSEAKGRDLAPNAECAGILIDRFRGSTGPGDVEGSSAAWAEVLKRMHPSAFPMRENRVCLPMIGRGQFLALLILGDRVGGARFGSQDFDMLKCIGDHATASLLNVQLGQRLLEAKELEAFQTMAAFFVHDLKNAASTLSLMLKNLPVHFEDPAFREDALRGMGKSVNHINHVIGRLSLLRNELRIQPAEVDLNDLVEEAVAGLGSEGGLMIEKDLGAIPKIPVDREQIYKVVANLVLNARDAMAGKGRLSISTTRQQHWAVLSVRDQGCGMNADFIERSLFRPFQTTKKNGLGIGLFQSKMIVEVHGGRIAVQSEPGAGTTFQVFLPMQRKLA